MSEVSFRSAANQSPHVGASSDLNASERVAFFLLLVVVGVRPLVGETYESALPPIVPPGTVPTGPGPVFSLTMGSLILLAAALAVLGWLRRAGSMERRPSGLGLGLALLTIGITASSFVASNRRLAMNASIDWFLTAGMCALLVWLLRRPWQVRLLLCVVVATGAAFAGQCVLQRFIEYRDTIAEYERHRAEFWGAQGIALEDPKVQLYERRLYAREASGYFPHSNVAGSFLILAAFAAAALATIKVRGAADSFGLGFGILTAILAAMLFGSILFTGSRGAMAAGLIAAALAAAWTWIVPRLRWGWQRRLLLGWVLLSATAGAVVLYARESSPRSSMGFRWDYWCNTSRLIRDYFWTGVGAQNFGRFYLEYKPIIDPEEIRDPHNFLLTAFAQWGVIGAGGLLALAVGVSFRLSQSVSSSGENLKANGETGVPATPAEARQCGAAATRGNDIRQRSPLPWLAALIAGIFLLRLWTILGNPPNYLFYATVVPLITWCITFVFMMLESNRFTYWSNAAIAPVAGLVLVAGCLAFLLHGMIDMAVFYPGTATTLFALAAVALAIKHQASTTPAAAPSAERLGRPRFAVLAMPGAIWATYMLWLWFPAAVVQANLGEARRLAMLETEINDANSAALAKYHDAIGSDPLDPCPPMEAAEWLLSEAMGKRGGRQPEGRMARAILDEAARLIHVAGTRDPREISIFRTKTSIDYLRAAQFGSLVFARAAVGAAKDAVNLYPQSPQDRLLLAEAMVMQSGLEAPENRSEFLRDAIEQYEHALRMDAARPGEVELRRWPAHVRQELADRIDELKAATTRPASEPTATAPGRHLLSSGRDASADN